MKTLQDFANEIAEKHWKRIPAPEGDTLTAKDIRAIAKSLRARELEEFGPKESRPAGWDNPLSSVVFCREHRGWIDYIAKTGFHSGCGYCAKILTRSLGHGF